MKQNIVINMILCKKTLQIDIIHVGIADTEIKSQINVYLDFFVCLPVYCKNIIKNTGEPPDKGILRARFGRVPKPGTSVPMELGCTTLPKCRFIHQPGSSSNCILLGF